ncbi:hypothetical protein Leryth_023071 [Lithospermum erythrorhizon]|nr:hypothetical protein Leryth_023071 [Lithospermum erythrorhizon]
MCNLNGKPNLLIRFYVKNIIRKIGGLIIESPLNNRDLYCLCVDT